MRGRGLINPGRQGKSMTVHPVYEQLLAEIDPGLERQVFEVMLERQGQRVTRAELVLLVFGETVSPDQLANNIHDRQIRECIERLQERDYPILASSAQAGYILTDDDAEIDAYIRELSSRAEHIRAKVIHLYAARQKAASMRQWRTNPPEAVQARLI